MYSNLPYYHYTQKKKHVKHAADIFTTFGTLFLNMVHFTFMSAKMR